MLINSTIATDGDLSLFLRNTSRPRRNGLNLADDIFKGNFLKEDMLSLIEMP